MKIQTKSGFVCEVDEAKVTDWRFCKALAKCDSGDESAMIQGVTYVVPLGATQIAPVLLGFPALT